VAHGVAGPIEARRLPVPDADDPIELLPGGRAKAATAPRRRASGWGASQALTLISS